MVAPAGAFLVLRRFFPAYFDTFIIQPNLLRPPLAVR
jgi:hypothetical protein